MDAASHGDIHVQQSAVPFVSGLQTTQPVSVGFVPSDRLLSSRINSPPVHRKPRCRMRRFVPISESIGCPLNICVSDNPSTNNATAPMAITNMIQSVIIVTIALEFIPLLERE